MSWNGTASLWLICDWPQSADKHAATSFKRCEALGEGSVFSVFSLLSWLQRGVCAISCSVPAVPLTALSHMSIFCYQTPPVIKRLPRWNHGTAKSHGRSCDCAWVAWPPWLLLTETACWGHSIPNKLESGVTYCITRRKKGTKRLRCPTWGGALILSEEWHMNVPLRQHAAL